MSWGDLSWLGEYGYEKLHAADEHRWEAWILRGVATKRLNDNWREVTITWTGDQEAQEYVEVSAGLFDDNLCFVHVSINNVEFKDLRQRLEWYERRVLQMLQLGLDSAAGGGVA